MHGWNNLRSSVAASVNSHQRKVSPSDGVRFFRKMGNDGGRHHCRRHVNRACSSWREQFLLLCPDRISKTPGAHILVAKTDRQKKSASKSIPEDRDRGIPAQTRGSKSPKARLVLPAETRGRPRPPMKSSHGNPLAGPRQANTNHHHWTLGGTRCAFAGRPLFCLTPQTFMEEDNPRQPVARHVISAGQCRQPAMRQEHPSNRSKIQPKNDQVQQPARPGAKCPSASRPLTGRHDNPDRCTGRG